MPDHPSSPAASRVCLPRRAGGLPSIGEPPPGGENLTGAINDTSISQPGPIGCMARLSQGPQHRASRDNEIPPARATGCSEFADSFHSVVADQNHS